MRKDLTDDQAMDVYLRAWSGDETQPEIAAAFGISRAMVGHIKVGRTYSEVTGHKYESKPRARNFNTDQVMDIYSRVWSGEETMQQIGDEYGITTPAVNAIKHGKSYSDITGHIKGTTGRAAKSVEKPITQAGPKGTEVVEPITEVIPVETVEVVPNTVQIPIQTNRTYSNMMLECLLDADAEIYPGLVVTIRRLKELEALTSA